LSAISILGCSTERNGFEWGQNPGDAPVVTIATTTASSQLVVVASTAGFFVGMHPTIAGAGTNGQDWQTTVILGYFAWRCKI